MREGVLVGYPVTVDEIERNPKVDQKRPVVLFGFLSPFPFCLNTEMSFCFLFHSVVEVYNAISYPPWQTGVTKEPNSG